MFLLRCHWIFQKFLITYNPPHFPPISKSKNPQTRETPHNSFFCGTNFLSVLPFLSLHSPPHHLLHFSSFFFLKPEAKLLHKSHSDNVVVIVTSLYLFFFFLCGCVWISLWRSGSIITVAGSSPPPPFSSLSFPRPLPISQRFARLMAATTVTAAKMPISQFVCFFFFFFHI